jgi:hypothetical protein
MNLSVVYKFCDNVILLNESIYLLYTDSDIVFLQCIWEFCCIQILMNE